MTSIPTMLRARRRWIKHPASDHLSECAACERGAAPCDTMVGMGGRHHGVPAGEVAR